MRYLISLLAVLVSLTACSKTKPMDPVQPAETKATEPAKELQITALTVSFAPKSAWLRVAERTKIKDAFEKAQKEKSKLVIVTAADPKASQKLAERRAKAIQKYLVEKLKVKPEAIKVKKNQADATIKDAKKVQVAWFVEVTA